MKFLTNGPLVSKMITPFQVCTSFISSTLGHTKRSRPSMNSDRKGIFSLLIINMWIAIFHCSFNCISSLCNILEHHIYNIYIIYIQIFVYYMWFLVSAYCLWGGVCLNLMKFIIGEVFTICVWRVQDIFWMQLIYRDYDLDTLSLSVLILILKSFM